MTILRSTIDWTGRDVNGIILGEPVIDQNTGEFIWDHPDLPGDLIDEDGDIWMEIDNA